MKRYVSFLLLAFSLLTLGASLIEAPKASNLTIMGAGKKSAGNCSPGTVFEVVLSANEAGYSNYTVRDVIHNANLSAATGSYARVTINIFSLGDTNTFESYIGQAASSGAAYDATAMVQLTGGDFGSGTYTKSGGAGNVVLVSGYILLNETYDHTKNYIVSGQFSPAGAATVWHTPGPSLNRTYYRSGASASEAVPAINADNGEFTAITQKIEIGCTP